MFLAPLWSKRRVKPPFPLSLTIIFIAIFESKSNGQSFGTTPRWYFFTVFLFLYYPATTPVPCTYPLPPPEGGLVALQPNQPLGGWLAGWLSSFAIPFHLLFISFSFFFLFLYFYSPWKRERERQRAFLVIGNCMTRSERR